MPASGWPKSPTTQSWLGLRRGVLAVRYDDRSRGFGRYRALWDLPGRASGGPSGAWLSRLPARKFDVCSFSPDRSRVVVAGEGLARLYDTASGQPIGAPMRIAGRESARWLSARTAAASPPQATTAPTRNEGAWVPPARSGTRSPEGPFPRNCHTATGSRHWLFRPTVRPWRREIMTHWFIFGMPPPATARDAPGPVVDRRVAGDQPRRANSGRRNGGRPERPRQQSPASWDLPTCKPRGVQSDSATG